VLQNPQIAKHNNIFVVPALIRVFPTPQVKIVGDLSNEESVLEKLDLKRRT